MYRTLLATCGSEELPYKLSRLYKKSTSVDPHVASNVRYIAFPLRTNRFSIRNCLSSENELPTHTLQATCGTLLSNENQLLTHVPIFGRASVRYFHVTPYPP